MRFMKENELSFTWQGIAYNAVFSLITTPDAYLILKL